MTEYTGFWSLTFDPVSNEDGYSAANRDNPATYSFGRDSLGVFVDAKPEQNEYEVTVKYRIVGGETIYRTSVLLTPTR